MTYVTVIDAVIDAVYLCSVPSALMLALSLIAFAIVVEPTLVAALQHLAAGIVLSAVAVELVPTILASPRDFSTTFGMTVGFFCGIAFFLVLSKFVGEDDDDKDSDDEEGPATSYMEMDAHGRTRSSSLPTASEEVKLAAAKKLSKVGTMKALSTVTTTSAAPPPFPIVLSTAVAVDALVDGLLIGISSASGGTKAGVVIAAALSIEMSFLGLTFASSIKQQPAHRRLIAIIVPPLLLVAGGALGGSLGALSRQHATATHGPRLLRRGGTPLPGHRRATVGSPPQS